jgi:hypothetical protein
MVGAANYVGTVDGELAVHWFSSSRHASWSSGGSATTPP